MGRFILRRLLTAIPVLLGILAVVFAIARLIPGDPCIAALGERATEEVCNAYNERYGLNRSIPAQFAIYIGDVLQGDLGTSFRFNKPVTDLMIERLPTTIELSVAALTIAVFVGVPLGVISAYRHNSKVDVATMVGANIGVSMPVFWLGLMLQYLFAVQLKDTFLSLPPSGRLDAGMLPEPFWEKWGLPENGVFEFISNLVIVNAILTLNWDAFWSAFTHLILPAVALATIPLAIIARMTRSSLLDVLGLDYVRTARAKGQKERMVVLRHGLRNAMLPVITVIGLSLGALMGGAILTETIFNLSGVGKTLFDAIESRDYTVVQGFTLIIAVAFVLVNMVVDIMYTYLDPRVRSADA
ncbi:ABC transporter permease [Ilumatobacter nonamiensis]|uniref:ABC transporter permease n=1 Tax=Ilumatobacter nonamiensis TaxID=467093 RepID=UPI00034A58AF|nr:ABC transporter permease [Ilumatobacter nonamiensis]